MTSPASGAHGAQKNQNLWPLAVGAIGVVYGDIGTSPLYAFREAMLHVAPAGSLPAVSDVFGVLSLILWSLMIVVTLKYVTILLKIDNHGEGGTLALMALARSVIFRNTTGFLLLGILGAALFYGDAIITPAISVLSAVEGLKTVTPAFEPYIMPITIAIIVALFAFQSRGTAGVSRLFGPVTCLWFAVLGLMGFVHILHNPEILLAASPHYAVMFMMDHGALALVTLGAVFLAVTGAEALYADLGHFGRRPIQLAWGWFVFPSLMLNYFGQGALVLQDPSAMEHPFFHLVSGGLQLPLVILAGVATIIASQAVITGAYSLTQQAVNLGILPRMKITYTSDQTAGQIYMPQINYLLMIGTLLLVVLFKSSGALAAAYGISVTGTMVTTAIMAFFVLWQVKEWKLSTTILVVGPFFIIDCIFLGANLLKVADGGWVPLTLALCIAGMMLIWIRGTFILNGRARRRDIRVEKFLKIWPQSAPLVTRVPGTAFFLTGDAATMPPSLIQNLKHNRILHERTIILSVKIEPVPYMEEQGRSLVSRLSEDFTLVIMRFGFKEVPDVQRELIRLHRDPLRRLTFDWENTSLFLSRKVLRSQPSFGMPAWQDWVYIFLSRNATDPTDYFRLPTRRVIEIGRHVII